jgi:hypothetical protein
MKANVPEPANAGRHHESFFLYLTRLRADRHAGDKIPVERCACPLELGLQSKSGKRGGVYEEASHGQSRS